MQTICILLFYLLKRISYLRSILDTLFKYTSGCILTMKFQQVINCMFTNWYSRFKDITIKSIAINLSESVCEYLLSDSFVLPNENDPQRSDITTVGDSDEELDWENKTEHSTLVPPSFPDLEKEVMCCIESLGGCVFPKLDWSSPKDAAWISFDRTLRCRSIRDIFLLLKSSDFITHDLTAPFEHCSNVQDSANQSVTHHLVLRQWQDISAESEFRCFVQNNTVVGISQRHLGIHFPHLNVQKEQISSDILRFYHTYIEEKFADSDFTFDVWCKSGEDIVLLDFNPFAPVTDSLLFSWNELMSWSPHNPSNPCEFRCVLENGIQPDPYRWYAMPQDFVHLSTGEDPAKLTDLLNIKIQDANEQESDSN